MACRTKTRSTSFVFHHRQPRPLTNPYRDPFSPACPLPFPPISPFLPDPYLSPRLNSRYLAVPRETHHVRPRRRIAHPTNIRKSTFFKTPPAKPRRVRIYSSRQVGTTHSYSHSTLHASPLAHQTETSYPPPSAAPECHPPGSPSRRHVTPKFVWCVHMCSGNA